MNRPLFIIIGSVLILVLLLVWVYILFIKDNSEDNNTGTSGTFTNLDIGDTGGGSNDPNSEEPDNQEGTSTIDTLAPDKLRQLTTKHVAGFSEINASTSDVVYIIEAGVGHIYEIDIFTGQERRISATTFPDTYSGDITSDGKYFALQTGYSANRNTHVGTIDSQSAVQTRDLETGIVSYSFLDDSLLGYAVAGPNSVVVRTYDFEGDASETLFTIPFKEAAVVWGQTKAGPHYFFPKPAEGLEGFVYEFNDGAIRRLPLDGFNLTAYGSQHSALATYEENSKYQTSFYNKSSDENILLKRAVLPPKCVQTFDTYLVCGVDQNFKLDQSYLTRWQKGLIQFTDDVYRIDPKTGESQEIANTKAITGRVVDITKIEQGMKYNYVYFINKNDQTLWIYEYEPVITTNASNDSDE